MNGSSYRFRLERIRALRERREDEAKAQLASAMQRRYECEQQLDEAEQRVQDARRAQQHTGPSSAQELLARQNYLERAEQVQHSNLENLRRHEEAEAGRRAELTAAAQAREALDRLKQKGLAQHRRDEARAESLALDEIAINGYRRRAA